MMREGVTLQASTLLVIVALTRIVLFPVAAWAATPSARVELDGKELRRNVSRIELVEAENTPGSCSSDGATLRVLVVLGDSYVCDSSSNWIEVSSTVLSALVEKPLPVAIEIMADQTISLSSAKEPELDASNGLCAGRVACMRLRRSVVDKNTIQKPAQFQWTNPSAGETTLAADLGVTVMFLPVSGENTQLDWGINAEYHRNTAPTAEQDSILAGVNASYSVGDISERNWAQFFDGRAQYKRDQVKPAEGLQVLIDYIPVRPRGLFRIGRALDIGEVFSDSGAGWLDLLFQPSIGLEYDGIYAVEDAADPTGSIGRFYLNVEGAIYPFSGENTLGLDKRLELFARYAGWAVLGTSDPALGSSGDWLEFWTAGGRYYFDSGKRFSLSFSYLDGVNPREARPESKYWQGAAEIKF